MTEICSYLLCFVGISLLTWPLICE